MDHWSLSLGRHRFTHVSSPSFIPSSSSSAVLRLGLQIFFCDKIPGDPGAADLGTTATEPKYLGLEVDYARLQHSFAGYSCGTLETPLTELCFNFFNCKVGEIIAPIYKDYYSDKWGDVYIMLKTATDL